MLDVAVVIPNLNGVAVLGACLDAISSAAGSLSWQTIVVDNASSDDSVPFLSQRPDVSLLKNAENLGFATACNRGKGIESRYVLLLNNDVVLTESSLERLVSFADAHPTLGALTPLMCWPDGRIQGPRLGVFRDRKSNAVAMTWAPGTCLLLRRSALDEVGWLDEAFFFYNEDLDLSWRLRKAGWGIACMPNVRVHHHEGSSTRTDSQVRARAILEGYRGSLLLARKHYPWALASVRFGLRLEVEWRALRLERKRRRGIALVDREEALSLCLPELRASLAVHLG